MMKTIGKKSRSELFLFLCVTTMAWAMAVTLLGCERQAGILTEDDPNFQPMNQGAKNVPQADAEQEPFMDSVPELDPEPELIAQVDVPQEIQSSGGYTSEPVQNATPEEQRELEKEIISEGPKAKEESKSDEKSEEKPDEKQKTNVKVKDDQDFNEPICLNQDKIELKGLKKHPHHFRFNKRMACDDGSTPVRVIYRAKYVSTMWFVIEITVINHSKETFRNWELAFDLDDDFDDMISDGVSGGKLKSREFSHVTFERKNDDDVLFPGHSTKLIFKGRCGKS